MPATRSNGSGRSSPYQWRGTPDRRMSVRTYRPTAQSRRPGRPRHAPPPVTLHLPPLQRAGPAPVSRPEVRDDDLQSTASSPSQALDRQHRSPRHADDQLDPPWMITGHPPHASTMSGAPCRCAARLTAAPSLSARYLIAAPRFSPGWSPTASAQPLAPCGSDQPALCPQQQH